MAPKKKTTKKEIENPVQIIDSVINGVADGVMEDMKETLPNPEEVVPMLPPDLSVDYPSEGLNNMAKTINEILAVLRYGK